MQNIYQWFSSILLSEINFVNIAHWDIGNCVRFWCFLDTESTFEQLLSCQSQVIVCSWGLPFISSLFHLKILIFDQFMAWNLSKLARMPKYGCLGDLDSWVKIGPIGGRLESATFLKSLVTGPSLLVNWYLEIKWYKINQGERILFS